MDSYLNLVILLSNMAIIVSQQTIDIKCNDKTRISMDKNINKLIVVGQKNLKFPVNEIQLRPYCNLAFKTIDQVGVYNDKCLPKFGRDSARVIMHAISAELRAVCKLGRLTKRARELLTAAPCANAGLKNWQKCYQILVTKFTGIVNAPAKQRLPMGCCNFQHLIQCLTDEAENVKQCTRKTVDFVLKYLNKMIDPLLNLICGDYGQPSDKCDAMVRLTPNITKGQTTYKSFMMPLINLAISIGDDPELE
ncbi:uncharacterized protein LOC128953815 [Oppia nitens]|uniref:uncharacterized protein LOC128953815 n=1 Tax=Oppia nitens TaxID=1686743 RepID=UPI0023DCA448|nr:uncharacterized protein LOC128953815 [Oppia nitens]